MTIKKKNICLIVILLIISVLILGANIVFAENISEIKQMDNNQEDIVNNTTDNETEVQESKGNVNDKEPEHEDETSDENSMMEYKDVSESDVNEEKLITFFDPINVPVYGDYESGIVPMSVDDYITGKVTTYKRLDMFNPNTEGNASYHILNMGIKYFSADNNSTDASYLGLKRVVYCIEYSKSTPNVGIDFSYTFSGNNINRAELYVMANGVRYLNQECVNASFRTGLGADYDYYVTQIALHLVRGEFTYDYFKNKMLSARSSVTDAVKNTVLNTIWKLYNHGVNITTDPNMFYLYGTSNTSSILYNSTGSTHTLQNVKSVWTQNNDGLWCSPYANPVSKDAYGGDLRPYYRGISVSTDTSGVYAHVAYEHGGTVSQGFHLYMTDAKYKSLQETGATITVTVKLTLPNAFAGRVLDFSVNNNYQNIEYFGTLTDWGNYEATVTAQYTIPKMSTSITIYKKDFDSKKALSGATFGLYKRDKGSTNVMDASNYNVLIGTFQDNGDGSYTLDDIAFSSDPYFAIGEISPPDGYEDDFVKDSSLDYRNGIAWMRRPIKYDTSVGTWVSSFETSDTGVATFYDKAITKGKLYLQKTSANTSVTEGNSCYSLKGAEYTVYTDSSCTASVGVLTTDENGKSNTIELDMGTYYVKETKVPKGYENDSVKYTVIITSSHATSAYILKVEDEPEMAPVDVVIKKVDADTMEPTAQGAGSTLEGAEFTVSYYATRDSSSDPALRGESWIRQWVIKTDADGYAKLDKEYLVSGSNLYQDETGKSILPIGTVTIKETKASEGYLLNEETFIVPISSEGSTSDIFNYQIPIIPEPSLKLNVKKVQEGTNTAIQGAVFEHMRPKGDTETLVTDEEGKLSFVGLEYGVHTIKEIAAPDGYQINENVIEFTVYEDNTVKIDSKAVVTDSSGNVTVTLDQDGNVNVLVEEKAAPYSFQILKKNSKGSVLASVEFTLYEDADCKKSILEKQTDSEGICILDGLTEGKTYYVKETKAPVGYKVPEKDPVYKIHVDACPAEDRFDFYINDQKYTAGDVDSSKTVYVSGDVSDRVIHMEIINTTGYLLPETGSNGTIVLLLLGSLLMMLALMSEDIKIRLRKGFQLIMKNRFLISLLTFSLLFASAACFIATENVQAASYVAESGVANCGNGSASIMIYGNEGQSLVGKKFNVYRLFHAENSVGGESINYTFNDTYKQALQNIVGARIYKNPGTVTEYDVIDYIQTLNKNKVDGAYTVQNLEGRYSEFRYFVETLRDEIVKLGCDCDMVTVNSVSSYNSFQMTGLQYGYYIVDEVTATDESNAASSLCMVTTSNPSASISIKSDRPTITKKVQQDDTDMWSDIADFEIGQKVPYQYTSNIPNINGYDTYYYAWHDVMDEALTLDKDSVSIVISDSVKSYTLVADEFKVTEKPDASTTFMIEITDIKGIVDREFDQKDSLGHNMYGQTVTVTYNAVLNDKAAEDTGRPGFENDVRLEFSNNPDITANGDQEEETGFTPWDTVVSFTYKLDVLKTNDKDLPLENAKFRLYSDEDCKNEVFVKKSANGYIVINRDAVGGMDHTGGTAPSDAVEMSSDINGKFTIFGLDDGIYYLKETDAPDGYRQILDPIKLTVDATYTTEVNDYIKGDGATDKTLQALDITADIKLFLEGKYEESTNELVTDVETGSGNLTIINYVGSKLPVTGSVGTIVLILLGTGAMMIGLKKKDEE